MISPIKELPIPDAVRTADRALEMARIWVADGDQYVVLSPTLWKDPGAWGLMLVDLARHVASAYQAQGSDRGETLARIHAAFQAEWAHPTGATS